MYACNNVFFLYFFIRLSPNLCCLFVNVCLFPCCFSYTVIYEKGYQEYDDVVSATSAKVKGTSYAQLPTGANTRVWDTVDYVVPPLVSL